jgi:hypothetical protein
MVFYPQPVICITGSPANVLYFSIAIIRVSISKGTRLLALVDASKGEILTPIEQGKCMCCI